MRRALCLASSLALAMALTLPPATGAPSTIAQEPGSEPWFAVSPIRPPDHMWGMEWVPDSEVMIEIDDPDTPVPVDFSMSTLTYGADGRFELYDMPFDIEAGHIVTVSQGATAKIHVVIDFAVTLMDPISDVVSGFGAPNTETVVYVGDGQHVVMSDATGAWTADFSVPDADGRPAFDIQPGMTPYAYQADDDGDQTQFDYWLPVFWVSVHDNWIGGENWPPEVDLTITADDPETVANPDSTLTLSTNAEGVMTGDEAFPGPLEPGWFITVTDGVTTKTHTVRNISITDVDPATEIVRGTADPFTEVEPGVFEANDGPLPVVADSNGDWLCDFSTDYDITPGSLVMAAQIDEDGDHTYAVGWEVPRPDGWQHNPATGHDYLFVGEGMTWANAEEHAVSLGGHLVTINDAAENGWLIATFGTEYLIGFNDIAVEGSWVWVSGEPVTFTSWLEGEPNDLTNENQPVGEDVAHIWNRPPIGWNDIPVDSVATFVVEVGPTTLDELLDEMVADGRLPNTGIANSILKQAEKAPLKALTNHLTDLVRRGVITQQTMDQILVMVAS